MSTHYDVVIIGSGAGGGTIARALASTGRRILVVERGGTFERDAGNWDPAVVWMEQRYRTKERWLSPDGEFQPNMHYGVGGNTKFWGAVLYRLREEDFEATEHADGESPAWPIRYEDLAPYYDRAEQLYHVHGQAGANPTDPPRSDFPYPAIPHTAGMQRAIERLQSQGLHPSPLPLGLIGPGDEGGCRLCGTCNSFPCRIGAKSDAETCGILPAREMSANLHLEEHTFASRLVTGPAGRRVVAVDVETHGAPRRIHGDLFIVSCGAVNSAALLLRSGRDGDAGLANSSGLVGSNYMAHLTTMYSAFGWTDAQAGPHEFQKTIAVNDYYRPGGGRPYPLGHIQSQGAIHPEMIFGGAPRKYQRGVAIVRGLAPRSFKYWTDRSMQWLAMTEDLPLPENRVTLRGGRICLAYHPSNTRAHEELKNHVKLVLRACGTKTAFPVSFGLGNTTHQCGTLRFGADPRTSVLDPWCRTHDVANLFVVDASFFPSSAAVNPGLTIVAQALRVADHIRERDLKTDKGTESMRVRSWSHVGITVSDFNRAVRFYWDVFGCPLVGVTDVPPNRVRGFFGVDVERATCKIGWIRLPGGAVIEIFHFSAAEGPINVRWNRIGLTHICVNVRGIHKWHDYLVKKGVEIVSPPEQSPRGHWLFFAKDFDGNLVEITDLGYMYYVLGWLGPLGGWIFRRGMYHKYYQA